MFKIVHAYSIKVCDKKSKGGLSWEDIRDCVSDFQDEKQRRNTSKQDFDKLAGEDNLLTQEEWGSSKRFNCYPWCCECCGC